VWARAIAAVTLASVSLRDRYHLDKLRRTLPSLPPNPICAVSSAQNNSSERNTVLLASLAVVINATLGDAPSSRSPLNAIYFKIGDLGTDDPQDVCVSILRKLEAKRCFSTASEDEKRTAYQHDDHPPMALPLPLTEASRSEGFQPQGCWRTLLQFRSDLNISWRSECHV